jgi:hypothetical protein
LSVVDKANERWVQVAELRLAQNDFPADRRSRGRRISKYTAGITNMDSKGAVIMPPTMGAAMRCITSEPVPVPHMMGSKPAEA